MYAEAFFENDIVKIIEAGLKCIPQQCQYAEMVRDMVQWRRENPDRWEKTWELVDDKLSLTKDLGHAEVVEVDPVWSRSLNDAQVR